MSDSLRAKEAGFSKSRAYAQLLKRVREHLPRFRHRRLDLPSNDSERRTVVTGLEQFHGKVWKLVASDLAEREPNRCRQQIQPAI